MSMFKAVDEIRPKMMTLAIRACMGSGGNVGAQSGTLIVRALAVGDLESGRWRLALKKELLVGVVLGRRARPPRRTRPGRFAAEEASAS